MLENHEVAIFHPPRVIFQNGDVNAHQLQAIGECISHTRQLFEEAADRLGHRIALYEYPLLYSANGTLQVPNRRDRRQSQYADTAVVIDPSPQVLAFASSNDDQPVRRTLMVSTEQDGIRQRIDILKLMKSMIIDKQGIQSISRVFALHLSQNADQASEDFSKNQLIVERVLRYPAA